MDSPSAPPPPPRRWRTGEWALVVLAVLALVGAAKVSEPFIVPVIAGVMMSYALGPVVQALERIYIHRVIGAALVLMLAIGMVGGTAYLLRADATALVAELPQAARQLRQVARQGKGPEGPIEHVREAAAELNRAAAEATGGAQPATTAATPRPAPPAPPSAVQAWVTQQSAKVVTVIGQLAIAALLAYFLLAAGDSFRRKLVHLAGPTLAKRRITVEILDDIHVQVQRYLLILLSTNAMIAFATWVILLAFGIERAGLWGVVAGVLHVIPYAGTAMTTVVILIAAFLQTDSIGQALLVAASVFAAASAIGMGLVPWLQGRAARMNAAAVFVSLLFFGWLWDGWGLLLGAPLVAILKTVADRVPRMEPLGELLGGATVQAAPADQAQVEAQAPGTAVTDTAAIDTAAIDTPPGTAASGEVANPSEPAGDAANDGVPDGSPADVVAAFAPSVDETSPSDPKTVRVIT